MEEFDRQTIWLNYHSKLAMVLSSLNWLAAVTVLQLLGCQIAAASPATLPLPAPANSGGGGIVIPTLWDLPEQLNIGNEYLRRLHETYNDLPVILLSSENENLFQRLVIDTAASVGRGERILSTLYRLTIGSSVGTNPADPSRYSLINLAVKDREVKVVAYRARGSKVFMNGLSLVPELLITRDTLETLDAFLQFLGKVSAARDLIDLPLETFSRIEARDKLREIAARESPAWVKQLQPKFIRDGLRMTVDAAAIAAADAAAADMAEVLVGFKGVKRWKRIRAAVSRHRPTESVSSDLSRLKDIDAPGTAPLSDSRIEPLSKPRPEPLSENLDRARPNFGGSPVEAGKKSTYGYFANSDLTPPNFGGPPVEAGKKSTYGYFANPDLTPPNFGEPPVEAGKKIVDGKQVEGGTAVRPDPTIRGLSNKIVL